MSIDLATTLAVMMSPVDVHLSKPVEIMESDRNRAVATLTLAFAGDPVGRWAYPAAQQYLTYWPRFIEAFGGRAFSHGTAHALEGCLAVALWLPSGVGPDELAISAVMDESLTGPIRHEVLVFSTSWCRSSVIEPGM